MQRPVKLTADLIEAFAGSFLSPRYDKPRPTAPFHRKAWELYASDCLQAMVIAPRDHAKSTALTFDYSLAEAMFRTSDYIIIVGSTEESAQEQLSNISEELHENEDLSAEFGPFVFEVDTKTDIVVRLPDSHRFRILVRGAEQRIRGRLWRGKRPNLLICDDMEDDEQVMNADRRKKFRNWFFRAAKQALGKGGKVRVHGTVLHEDSLLARLRKNSQWQHLFFKAHASFDDFSDLLWPARWSEKELRAKRQEMIDDRDPQGYSQEFLNDPQDTTDSYLRKEDFIRMSGEDRERQKLFAAGWDFAVSTADSANRSCGAVGGKDATNLLHIVDVRVGKWDSPRLIDEMFGLHEAWHPDIHFVEDGVIWKTIAPMVYKEMQRRDVFFNIVPLPSVKDKATRGRILQRYHRARAMRFDKDSSWYEGYEHECLRFTEYAEATLDDQFDATSILCRGFEQMPELEQDDFDTDEEINYRRQSAALRSRGNEKEPGFRTGYR